MCSGKNIRFVLMIVSMLAVVCSAGGEARATASRTLEATFTSVSNGWVKVERWKDNDSNFILEDYPHRTLSSTTILGAISFILYLQVKGSIEFLPVKNAKPLWCYRFRSG